MISMIRVADIIDPCDEWMIPKPICHFFCILGMSLTAYGERLQTDQQLLSCRRAQTASGITEDFELTAHAERSVAKPFPQPRLGIMELREPL